MMILKNRSLANTLILLLIIGASIFFSIPVRKVIRNSIYEYAASYTGRIEQQYGIRVEYESISPSFINVLRIDDLHLYISADAERSHFTEIASADSLQIRYNYRELLFRPIRISSLKISADTLSISADYSTAAAYIEQLAETGDSMDAGAMHISEIQADIEEMFFSVSYEGITANGNAESVQLTSSADEGSIQLRYYDSEILIEAEKILELKNRYAADQLMVETSGISTFQLHDDSIQYSAERLSVSDDHRNILQDVPFSLLYSSAGFSASMIHDDFEFTADYSADTKQLTSSFDTQDLFFTESLNTPYLAAQLLPELDTYHLEKTQGAAVSIIVRAEAEAETEAEPEGGKGETALQTGSLAFSGTVHVPRFQKDAVLLEDIHASFSGSSTQIVLHELSASSDGMQFSYTGIIDIPDMNPSGTVSLTLPDNNYIDETIEIDIEKAPGGIQNSLDFSFSLQDDAFQIFSRLDYSDFTELSIQPTIKTADHFYYLPFTINFAEKFVYSHDASDITFSFDYSRSERQQAIAQWEDLILPIEEFSGIEDVSTSGRMIFLLDDAGEWSLQLSQFTVPDIKPLKEHPDYVLSLHTDAFITDGLMQLRNIILQLPSGNLRGNGSIDYSFSEKKVHQARIELSDTGKERYLLSFRQDDAFIKASADIIQGKLSRFPIISGDGTIDGSVEIAGNTDNLNYSINLRTENASLSGSRVSGDLNASITGNNFSIYSESASINTISFRNISAFYDFNTGRFDSFFDISAEAVRRNLQTAVTATSILPEVADIRELIQSGKSLLNTSIDISTSEIRLGEHVLADKIDAVASLRNSRLLIRGENNSFSGFADLRSHVLHVIVNADYPFSGILHGNWQNGEMELFMNDLSFDLQYLNTFTNEQIVFGESIVHGYLTISGNMSDPDFYGELYSDSIEISNPFIKHPLVGTNMYAAVYGKEIDFSRFNASVDAVSVETQLSISIEKWLPSLYSVSFSIPEDNPVESAYTFEGMRLAYDGKISGELGIEFNHGSRELGISGDLFADTVEISQFSRKNTETETNDISISVDMSITTGKNVHFILPNKELPILTATAEPQQVLRFDYTSRTNSFNVIGSINIKSGEIYYFKRNFYISSGNISLSETENNFNPLISLEAQLREFDRNANRVNIILKISSQQLGNLSPIIESNPQMELSEIAQILGANILTANPESSGTLSSAVAVATLASDIVQQLGFIEQLDVFNNLEQKVRNTLNLDVFSIRTQIIENVLYDVFPGESRYAVSENPIGKYLDNTTVLLGKYISENMFLQTMLQFNLNDSYGAGLFMTDALQMDMELSFDWQNPLYDFTISTTPELSNLNGILANTAVGLSWNYNF